MSRISLNIHFEVSVLPRRWVLGLEVDARSWPYLNISLLCFNIFIIQRPRTRDNQGKSCYVERAVTWRGAQ